MITTLRPSGREGPRGCFRNQSVLFVAYEILFHADRPNERLVYAVLYAFDAVTGEGYVYLPGKNDEHYALNVHTIIRRVEGKWFRSWDTWDGIAQQLIQSRRRGQSLTTASGNEP